MTEVQGQEWLLLIHSFRFNDKVCAPKSTEYPSFGISPLLTPYLASAPKTLQQRLRNLTTEQSKVIRCRMRQR